MRREITVGGRVVERPLPEGWEPDPEWDDPRWDPFMGHQAIESEYLTGPPEPIWWRRMVLWYMAWRNRP